MFNRKKSKGMFWISNQYHILSNTHPLNATHCITRLSLAPSLTAIGLKISLISCTLSEFGTSCLFASIKMGTPST